MTRIAALFDFDGTLYLGHLWQDLAHHHWTTKHHRVWLIAYVARNMARLPLYKVGLLDQTAFYRGWSETMAWLVRGWTVQEGQALFEQIADACIMTNLRAEVLRCLRRHQEQGHLVALVSGTFAPWLEVVAQRLAVSYSIGTPLEVRDECYTGRIVPPLCQGPGKPSRVQAYLLERGLEVDWEASYAYADSGTDVPLLCMVGHPVAVCPDEVLLSRAHSRGWAVLGGVG